MSIQRLPKSTAIYLVAAAMDRRLGTLRQEEFRWNKTVSGLTTGSLASTEYSKGAEAANMLLAANDYAVKTWSGKDGSLEVVHDAEMKAGLDLAAEQHAQGVNFDPMRVLRVANDFEYHCEVNLPSWQQSEALSFLTQLRHCAVAAIPGYLTTRPGVPQEWAALPDLTRRGTRVPDAPNPVASYVLHPEPPPTEGESHIL